MGSRWLPQKNVMAGALLGALAAFVIAAAGHLDMWINFGNGGQSSGATQGLDQWTYYSMCRAVWRSPNGFTYQYPYDLYWPAPAVAFQLPITLLAWIGRFSGLTAAFELARIAGGAGSGAAIAAIGLKFPPGFWRRWFYIAAAFGGSLFSIRAVALAIDIAGIDGLTELWEYQPKSEGLLFWWLPFLVRNLRLPLECLYHGLVLGSLACLMWKRYWWAWVFGLLLWMSNPFAAVALHAAVVPWLLWLWWETPKDKAGGWRNLLTAWLIVNATAAIYYGWFLNRWEVFRELHDLYQSAYVPALEWWMLLILLLPYGMGLVVSVATPRLRNAVWGSATWRLFGLLAIAHILLIQQSQFLGERSMQAYHYNRGYLQLGLIVIAWRVCTVLWRQYRCSEGAGRCRAAMVGVCSVVLLSCLDQVLFFSYAVSRPFAVGMVDSDYATLAQKIPVEPAPMLVVVEPGVLSGSYITAYTPHIAWDAPESMVVPYPHQRSRWFLEALDGSHGGVAGLGIDYAIMFANSKIHDALTSQGWQEIAPGTGLVLLQAPDPEAGQNPPKVRN